MPNLIFWEKQEEYFTNLPSVEFTQRMKKVKVREDKRYLLSKKMEGHIASGAFVRPSVRLSARSSRFLMHSITLKRACYCFEISNMDSS